MARSGGLNLADMATRGARRPPAPMQLVRRPTARGCCEGGPSEDDGHRPRCRGSIGGSAKCVLGLHPTGDSAYSRRTRRPNPPMSLLPSEAAAVRTTPMRTSEVERPSHLHGSNQRPTHLNGCSTTRLPRVCTARIPSRARMPQPPGVCYSLQHLPTGDGGVLTSLAGGGALTS
jgi:hypothetical protein